MIIALDTETYEQKEDMTWTPVLDTSKFCIGCLKIWESDKKPIKTELFYKPEQMLKRINELIETNIKNKRKTYLFAHNAEYDWYAIAKDEYLKERYQYVIFNPFLCIINKKAYLGDSMAFYKMPLEQIGEMLEIPKLEMPAVINDPVELSAYVIRDTEIVLKAILNLKSRFKSAGFNPQKMMTAGQLAMTCFLTFCKKNKSLYKFTELDENGKRIIIKSKYPKLVRLAYRGGDNQAYKTGKFQDCTMIDRNGSYSKVMQSMRFPDLKSERLIENPNLGMAKMNIQHKLGVVRCKIQTPSNILPLLPIRFNDYQVFPNNRTLHGTWTTLELKKALELGYELIKTDWMIIYNESPINPLKLFIDNLYKLEKNAKTRAEKIPIKMLRNNLSGKFGQYRKNKNYVKVKRKDCLEYKEKGYKVISTINNEYIMMKENGEYIPSYVNPIISALITAQARLDLYEEKLKLPIEDLLYCDTDSIIFKGKHIKKFKISNELGDWKIEDEHKTCKILGEKRYYIGEKVKISGIHSKDRTVSAIENEENLKVKRMIGIPMAILSGDLTQIGKFKELDLEMKTHNKLMFTLPDEIVESD